MSSEKSSKSMEISHEGPVTGSVVAEKLEKDESKVLTDQDCTSDQEHKHEKMNLEDSKSQDSVQSKLEVEKSSDMESQPPKIDLKKLSDEIEQGEVEHKQLVKQFSELWGTTTKLRATTKELLDNLELQLGPGPVAHLKKIYKYLILEDDESS